MSAIGARLRKAGGSARPDTVRATTRRPRGALSAIVVDGVVAFLLCVVAFVFWGINGASTLLDLVAALCA